MEDMLMYAMKLTLGLIGVMIVLKLIGKKELAQVTPLDFVYALILGGIIEESLYDATVPVYEMLFSIFFWALLIFVLEKFALKSRRFKSISQGDPQLLINEGHLDRKIMDENNMDVDEVRMLLRMKDVFSLSQVKYGILEESGELSVMQYAREEAPTRVEIMKEYSENVLPELLIDGGKVEHQRLKNINRDESWLRENIKKETGADLEDVFFAEWDEENGFFIQKNDDK
ncbi:DUF421 domain-containing protein [Jeotgalicoccus halotolerans]|uniref:Uncharacterized membrane protein YcaP (DUF421 family) n=2 Tax=Jeotgalicoccus halotolerans TaxID=157227 RepID=A0A3E0AVT2_9STAP|nr:DUF421 domain-containing protein [Jeotgalicoccus halotolerans]REG23829.1 uncharacterized membrane protein YcaP (DUF421 family) [Jeotgalicoccus halotolerans]